MYFWCIIHTKMDKNAYNKKKCGVYNLNYHIVWTPKRRKAVLVGLIGDRLKQVCEEKSRGMGINIEKMEVMPDHVHLFILAHPAISPHQIVKGLKGFSSHVLRREFPQLLRLPCLWSPSYYIGSVGFVSESVVKNYIENQKGK